MFKVGPVLTTSLYVHYLLSWDSSSSFATRCYLSTAVPSAKAVLIHSIACHDWQVKCDHHYIQEACISFLVVIILFVPLMCKKKKNKKKPNVQNSNNRLLLQRHLCTVAGNGGLFFISENATIPVNRWERWCTALWRTEMVPIWLHFTSKVSPFIYSIISIMTLQKYFGILAFLSSWWFWLIFLRKALLSCYISRRVWFSCLIFCQSPGNHSMWW